MKKILLLLLFTAASYGQAVFDEGVQIKNNVTDNSATKVNVQAPDGTINTISKSDLVNVVEVDDAPSLPLVGEVGKIYVVKNLNKIYRWNGTFYQELAGSDLTYQSIIAALTFTPENVANKTTDFTSVNNTLYPSVQAVKSQLDLKQNTLNLKTPQDYGAVGNGIADDTAAINACLSANSNVLLYGTYKISSTINIQSNQFIFSNNCTISSVVTGFVFLKADNVNNWGISGKLKVTGSGYSDSTSKALNVIGGYNYSVNGMIISEIDGWGILVENGVSNGTRGQRGTFSNVYINNCCTGS